MSSSITILIIMIPDRKLRAATLMNWATYDYHKKQKPEHKWTALAKYFIFNKREHFFTPRIIHIYKYREGITLTMFVL